MKSRNQHQRGGAPLTTQEIQKLQDAVDSATDSTAKAAAEAELAAANAEKAVDDAIIADSANSAIPGLISAAEKETNNAIAKNTGKQGELEKRLAELKDRYTNALKPKTPSTPAPSGGAPVPAAFTVFGFWNGTEITDVKVIADKAVKDEKDAIDKLAKSNSLIGELYKKISTGTENNYSMFSGKANDAGTPAAKAAIQNAPTTKGVTFGGSRIGSSKNTQKRRPKKQRQSGKGKSKRV
jgi:hypothetical protein